MTFYENTIVAKQDLAEKEIKNIKLLSVLILMQNIQIMTLIDLSF